MGIYIIELAIVVIISLIFGYINPKKEKKMNIIYMILIFFVLFFVMGCRNYNVGTDTKLYCNIFKYASTSNDIMSISSASPLYALYNKLIATIFNSSNTQLIIIFNSALIVGLMCLGIYRESENIYLSCLYYILFYFYMQGFNIARQFLTVALLFNSYYYIRENKKMKAIVLIGIATLIHNTAILFGLIEIVVMSIKPNMKNIKKITLIGIIMTAFTTKILELFLKIFPRYKIYFSSQNFYEVGQGRKIILTLIYVVIVAIGIFVMKKNEDKLKENNEYKEWFMLTVFMIFAIIIGFLSMKSMLLSRIEIYFSIFVILYMPKVINMFGRSKSLVYYCSLIIMFIPFYVLLSGNNSGIVPYHFFW